MGDRRPKKRLKRSSRGESRNPPPPPAVYAEYGLDHADFEVQGGDDGKSVLTGQWIMGMSVKHLPSGRTVWGETGTTKRGGGDEWDGLLRALLRPFRPR